MSRRPLFPMFLGMLRYSLLPLVVILVVGTLGVSFYVQGRTIMIQELKSRLRDTAAIAAIQFSPEKIEQLVTKEDMEKPAYREVVTRLRNTRNTMPTLRFAYIMRPTEDPDTLTFVADADALSTDAELDRNTNGTVDEDEMPGLTGDAYDISGIPALQNVTEPTVDETFTVDQWGSLISGYAPIRNAEGKVIAILGVDMDAHEFQTLSRRVFSPIALLLVAIIGLAMGGYVVFVQRQKRLESMQQLNAERTALMDLATHQLGAPLATFKWWIEMLQEHREKHPHTVDEKAEDDDAFAQLQEGIHRMDDIIAALRTAVHMQNKQVTYQSASVPLLSMLHAIPGTTQIMLQRRKQRLILEVPQNLCINVDEKVFIGVFQEFVENASWYSPEGSQITIKAKKVRRNVVIEVEDHGCGIPPEDLPHMFEQFKRASNATRHKLVGNGLGLYIAKGIIEGAQGTIRIESTPEKGTTFIITLPAA